MKPVFYPTIPFALLVFLYHGLPSKCHTNSQPSLLVISFNGFRWDFLTKAETPHLDSVLRKGVHAKQGVKNVFETSKLPNLWTFVTGLYPESHGVLRDRILLDRNQSNISEYFDSRAEPIWVTNQRQRKLAKSGLVMWSGAQYFVHWSKPIFYKYGESEKSPQELIDQVIEWFAQDEPINLGLVYLEKPDFCADSFGEDSERHVKESLTKADDLIGHLLSSLKDNHLLRSTNIIITSDHGCTSVKQDDVIDLTHVLSAREKLNVIEDEPSPVLSFFPDPEMEDESLYQKLKQVSDKPNSHFRVWRKADIPEHFYYKHNTQVASIVALADLHFFFKINSSDEKIERARHYGYDNNLQDMHPLFLAMGPSFKTGYAAESFSSVDVYPLMCHLLHLIPQPNNGSIKKVSGLFLTHETSLWTFQTYIILLIFISGVGGVYVVAACRQHRYLKHKRIQKEASSFQAGIRYTPSTNGSSVVRLLSYDEEYHDDEEEDEFNDSPVRQ